MLETKYLKHQLAREHQEVVIDLAMLTISETQYCKEKLSNSPKKKFNVS